MYIKFFHYDVTRRIGTLPSPGGCMHIPHTAQLSPVLFALPVKLYITKSTMFID